MKRLSDGELAELRTQLIDLLDRGWIQHSTAGHAAAVVFARKPDGTWRICYDYRGLNAITRPAVEPLPHIDALLDGTRGSRFFTKLDLASSYHQLRVRAADRWKTSFRSQEGYVEGCAEVAAPLTALGSPTARFSWTVEAQASFDALTLAFSSAPVLRTFDPARRAVLTTDASNIAVAAIMTQPNDEGRQHPVAYESRKLPALPAGRRGAPPGGLLVLF